MSMGDRRPRLVRRMAVTPPCATHSEEAPMPQHVKVFFHSQQPYTYVQDTALAQCPSGRLDFPNRYFDPGHAHVLHNKHHE